MITNVDFLAQANAQESGVVVVLLMTITHPDWVAPVRLSTDPTQRITETSSDVIYGTQSRGNDYLFLPAQITLPSQTEEAPPQMRISIDNVSRDLVAEIRALSSPPAFQVELVTADDPDTVLAMWPEFLMANIQYNATTINADLVIETLQAEPYPAGTFTPAEFPGVF